MNNPQIQPSVIQALQVNKSFCQIYVIEAIAKEQIKMQKQELDHHKVLMDVKIENLKLQQQINELEQRLNVSECSKKLLQMSIDKLKFDQQFLQSKIKICQSQVSNGHRNLATKKEQWKAKEKEENQKISQIHSNNTKEKQRLSLSIKNLKTQHKDQIQHIKILKENLQAENANLQKELAQEKKKNERLQIQREQITVSLEENFKEQLAMVEVHENVELILLVKQKLNECQTEIKSARESLNKFQKSQGFKGSSLSNIIDSIHQDLQKWKTRIETIRVDQYLTANGILKQLVQNYEEGNPDEILQCLKNQVTLHIKQYKQVKQKVQKLENSNQKLVNTFNDNENQFSNMKENQKKLKEEINSLKQSINGFTQKQKQLNQLNGQLKVRLLKCEQMAKQKEVKSQILFKQRDQKVEQNSNVLKQKQQLLQTKMNQLQQLQSMLRQKQQLIEKQFKQIEHLKDKIDTQENQIHRLEDRSKTLSEKCQGYQGKLSTNKKEIENLKKQMNERVQNYEKQLKSSQNKLQQMQRQLANLANKHIQTRKKQQQQEIHSYHQALEYFQNLISQSSSSSTPKKQDLFPVPSLSKNFESQENWVNNLISVYSNSKTFTSKFVARLEFTSPRELQTYLSQPNILLICQTNFKKVFAIFICKLSKLLKDVDPVVIFSSDCSLAYPSEPKKGGKCRPAMIVNSKLDLAKKQIVIQKSLQVSLQKGQYFGDIDKYKLFGIQDNSDQFKIQKMEIHRIVAEQ